jgi:hypothetical protein
MNLRISFKGANAKVDMLATEQSVMEISYRYILNTSQLASSLTTLVPFFMDASGFSPSPKTKHLRNRSLFMGWGIGEELGALRFFQTKSWGGPGI